MHRSRWTVQSFLDVRIALLDKTLSCSLRRQYPTFQAETDNHSALVAT
jgi:hypothetical protein